MALTSARFQVDDATGLNILTVARNIVHAAADKATVLGQNVGREQKH